MPLPVLPCPAQHISQRQTVPRGLMVTKGALPSLRDSRELPKFRWYHLRSHSHKKPNEKSEPHPGSAVLKMQEAWESPGGCAWHPGPFPWSQNLWAALGSRAHSEKGYLPCPRLPSPELNTFPAIQAGSQSYCQCQTRTPASSSHPLEAATILPLSETFISQFPLWKMMIRTPVLFCLLTEL